MRFIEERIKKIEDKVDYLSEHLNFICGEMIRKDKGMVIPSPRYDIGDSVYVCSTFMYFEKGNVEKIGSYCAEHGWSYLIRFYSTNSPGYKNGKISQRESWCHDHYEGKKGLFKNIDEYKEWLREKIEEIVKE